MTRNRIVLFAIGVLATLAVTLSAATPASADAPPVVFRTLTVLPIGSLQGGWRVTGPGIDCPGDCTTTVLAGLPVQLHQEATDPDVVFVGWFDTCDTESVPGSETCGVKMTVDRTVKVGFWKGKLVTVGQAGTGKGTGTIQSQNGSTSGGLPFAHPVPAGTQATVTAMPHAGSVFTGWGGACAGQANPCTLTVTQPATVTATFDLKPADQPPPPPTGGTPPAPPSPKSSPAHGCTITGTADNDTLTGTPGRDVICGLGGHDVISGVGGNDVLSGGAGNDLLLGGAGADVLLGGAGLDRLLGGAGKDVLKGGAGADRFFARDQLADRVEGGPGRDRAQVDVRKDRRTGIETLV
jgi:Divergent InlB B-repeat domain/RTX calcium-binding nonapeptide repeat (4 copies)